MPFHERIKKRNDGFTMMEVALGLTIMAIFTLGTIGLFVSYAGTLDEAGSLVLSKVKVMQTLGRMTPVDGYNGIARPYIKFKDGEIEYTEREMATPIPTLSAKTIRLKKRADNSDTNKIVATTDISGDIIYFDKKGLAVDSGGQRIEPTITITRTYAGEDQVMTIKVNDVGYVTHERD